MGGNTAHWRRGRQRFGGSGSADHLYTLYSKYRRFASSKTAKSPISAAELNRNLRNLPSISMRRSDGPRTLAANAFRHDRPSRTRTRNAPEMPLPLWFERSFVPNSEHTPCILLWVLVKNIMFIVCFVLIPEQRRPRKNGGCSGDGHGSRAGQRWPFWRKMPKLGDRVV